MSAVILVIRILVVRVFLKTRQLSKIQLNSSSTKNNFLLLPIDGLFRLAVKSHLSLVGYLSRTTWTNVYTCFLSLLGNAHWTTVHVIYLSRI